MVLIKLAVSGGRNSSAEGFSLMFELNTRASIYFLLINRARRTDFKRKLTFSIEHNWLFLLIKENRTGSKKIFTYN